MIIKHIRQKKTFFDLTQNHQYEIIKAKKTKEKKEVKIMVVTKDTLIGDVLDHNVETAQFFFEIGMHCLGCPASRGESIADACDVHGTDADALVEKINAYLASKEN